MLVFTASLLLALKTRASSQNVIKSCFSLKFVYRESFTAVLYNYMYIIIHVLLWGWMCFNGHLATEGTSISDASGFKCISIIHQCTYQCTNVHTNVPMYTPMYTPMYQCTHQCTNVHTNVHTHLMVISTAMNMEQMGSASIQPAGNTYRHTLPLPPRNNALYMWILIQHNNYAVVGKNNCMYMCMLSLGNWISIPFLSRSNTTLHLVYTCLVACYMMTSGHAVLVGFV